MRMSMRPYRSSAVSMIALPPSGVATESVLATASPPAAVISRTTSSAGAASVPPPARLPPGSLTTTLAPCAASSRAYERPSPLPPPVMTATRSSNLKSAMRHQMRSRAQLQATQVALVAPLLQQVVERVEAGRVGLTEERADAFAASAALVVVIARSAGHFELRVVDGEFANGAHPAVLGCHARLDGDRVPLHRLGDDVGDVLGLLLEHGRGVRGDAALNEAREELVGESAAGDLVQRLVAVTTVIA